MAPIQEKPVVLVTGSSGLIGTRVQEGLKEHYKVVGLDVKAPEQPVRGAAFLECDLTRDESVEATLARVRDAYGHKLASVVHLAAYYDFAGEPSPMYDELTVKGTQRLTEALQAFEVGQLIFSSSLLVMKPLEDDEERLTELSDTDAEWAYPASKLRAERILRDERGTIPVVVLRIAGVYDEDGHSLPIGQHIKRIYEKQLESFMFPGDKDHGQAYVHLDDLAACFRQVIAHRAQLDPFELFLIAEPDVMSHEELQETLGELLHGHEWPTIRIPKAMAKMGATIKSKLSDEELFIKPWMIDLADDHYAVDIRKAQERLDWHPQHRLRTTLEEIISRLKQDPEGWYKRNNLPLPKDPEKLRPVPRG